jgi:hypothetical protein
MVFEDVLIELYKMLNKKLWNDLVVLIIYSMIIEVVLVQKQQRFHVLISIHCRARIVFMLNQLYLLLLEIRLKNDHLHPVTIKHFQILTEIFQYLMKQITIIDHGRIQHVIIIYEIV